LMPKGEWDFYLSIYLCEPSVRMCVRLCELETFDYVLVVIYSVFTL
jgi:hypothetical protein